MSSEKSAEVVGCDASIMRNVWEIRARDYDQRRQLELQRVEKSALPVINQDWANRLSARDGGYKRQERKPKPPEAQPDANVWKSKPSAPRVATRGVGSGAPGKPGVQSRGFSAPTTTYKKGQEKTVQDRSLNKMQLLMFLNQTKPSPANWGKAWKYNKSLPAPTEGTVVGPEWGHCWMFAPQQPSFEAGKSWPDNPDTLDRHSLHLWTKPEHKMVESQQLDFHRPAEEWQMSWQRPEEMKKAGSADGENGRKSGFQRHNEALSSSEWVDSFHSTKPANQSDQGFIKESSNKMQDKDREMNPEWEECWKLVNHHGGNNFKQQFQKAQTLEWASSWRAATANLNHQNTSNHGSGHDDHGQQKESQHTLIGVSLMRHHRDMHMQLCQGFETPTEWNHSWQLTKNNSKPCEEINKVLKAPPPKMDSAKEGQKEHSATEKPDPRYEQLKHDVIYQTKREFPESKMLLFKQMQKMLPLSEWKDSWKILKHRMRMERRRYRVNPLESFRESENKDTKFNSSEWKDSWKHSCKPLNQEPDLWQQGWSTTPQIRVNWERNQNEFEPEQFPKNGPTSRQIWAESWRFSRRQHRSEPGQEREQFSQGKSGEPSHHHHYSKEREQYTRSISDWHEAWMVSETQFRHDRPSLLQWREAWRCCIYHTLHWTDHVPRNKWVNQSAEIQHPTKWIYRRKAKMSTSFDNEVFRQRYPEKEWRSSWSAESLLEHQPSFYGSVGTTGQTKGGSAKQTNPFASEYKSKWGRSFRLANPMPSLDQPWVESGPNPVSYAVWSRGMRQRNIQFNFSDTTLSTKLWANSYCFLQGSGSRSGNKAKSMGPSDPRVISVKKIQTRKHLYSDMEKEKQVDKKWAGCHLLGKTQPRPKKGRGKQPTPEDNGNDKLYDEWVVSWKFLVRPQNLRKQMAFKALLGWGESWKFLFPPYAPVLDVKGKSKA
ncbi:unnamed protein product [Menidia menidia]|uniref:(Atlantic silverside) hypothetical protein n=1 Tax=Menidia menidia TaxID=238744 RepID=A0A8S4AN15_9TELE|nr:unnamed protein product [Menidia menidia]